MICPSGTNIKKTTSFPFPPLIFYIMKYCHCCQKEKSTGDFNKNKKRPDGLQTQCRECTKQKTANWHKKQPPVERTKEEQEQYLLYQKEYRTKNKERLLFDKKDYYIKNKISLRPKKALYEKKRREADPNYKLTVILRQRLNKALKQEYKTGSAIDALGCSIQEARQYLEEKFKPGMTWANHGKGVGKWNVDHILPLASTKDQDEKIKLCHYTNLQPLWMEENCSKGARTIDE